MPTYCVNENAQANGDHEVHDLTPGACTHLPEPKDRKSLGWHTDCQGAVTEAKKTYRQSNGCYYCCRPCNTG
ncbi:MAG: hypothetical protein JWN40_1576 [Phycisphaerales bacterium]|nr:hypothetical protein [Phycisphaerales bacterium]